MGRATHASRLMLSLPLCLCVSKLSHDPLRLLPKPQEAPGNKAEPGAESVWTVFKLGMQRKENSLPCVHVLHKTLNFVISVFVLLFCRDWQRDLPKCACKMYVQVIVLVVKPII